MKLDQPNTLQQRPTLFAFANLVQGPVVMIYFWYPTAQDILGKDFCPRSTWSEKRSLTLSGGPPLSFLLSLALYCSLACSLHCSLSRSLSLLSFFPFSLTLFLPGWFGDNFLWFLPWVFWGMIRLGEALWATCPWHKNLFFFWGLKPLLLSSRSAFSCVLTCCLLILAICAQKGLFRLIFDVFMRTASYASRVLLTWLLVWLAIAPFLLLLCFLFFSSSLSSSSSFLVLRRHHHHHHHHLLLLLLLLRLLILLLVFSCSSPSPSSWYYLLSSCFFLFCFLAFLFLWFLHILLTSSYFFLLLLTSYFIFFLFCYFFFIFRDHVSLSCNTCTSWFCNPSGRGNHCCRNSLLSRPKTSRLVAPCGWEFNRGWGRGWESRPLSRFGFALVLKGFRHYSTTIARLSPLSGLERGGWGLPPVFGCEIGRDRGLPIALPIAEGVL